MNLRKLTDIELDRMANDDMLEANDPVLFEQVLQEVEWRAQNNPLDLESAQVMDYRENVIQREQEQEAARLAYDLMVMDSWYDFERDLEPMEPFYD